MERGRQEGVKEREREEEKWKGGRNREGGGEEERRRERAPNTDKHYVYSEVKLNY